MMHGPCSLPNALAWTMANAHFPMDFIHETMQNINGHCIKHFAKDYSPRTIQNVMATQCIAGECSFGSQLFVLVLAGISYLHMLSFMLPCSICAHVYLLWCHAVVQ